MSSFEQRPLKYEQKKGKGEEKKMKMEIKKFRGEWAFSITLCPGIFWIDFFYLSFAVMTTKHIKENKLNDI
jgi:hypothetical protein